MGDPGAAARAQAWRGEALVLLGPLDKAKCELEVAVQALEDLEELKGLEELGPALNCLGYVLRHLGQLVEAQAYHERALALAEQLEFPDAVAWQLATCGRTLFVRGDWTSAWSFVERAGALRPSLNTSYWVNATVFEIGGELQLAQGQLAAALQSAQAAPALAQRRGDPQRQRRAQRLFAELDMYNGDPAAARSRLLPLLDREGLIETDVNMLLPVLVWANLELGEVSQAQALATQPVDRCARNKIA